MFNIVGSLVPLVFASVVLWRYDPSLVAGLIGLIAITGAWPPSRRQLQNDCRRLAVGELSARPAYRDFLP